MDTFIDNKNVVAYIKRRYPGGKVEPIAGDASGRRFYRAGSQHTGTAVIMDYGRPFAAPSDDMVLAGLFLEAGLPVARVLHADPDGGFLVLEDLGERTLEAYLDHRPSDRERCYEAAVDLAAGIVRRGTPVLEASERRMEPALDRERFRFEMDYFLSHYYCGFKGQAESLTQIQPFRDLLHRVADRAAAVEPAALCHRDFHSRNLVVGPDGGLSMVDIQDARRGPLGYDLASLLWDAYVDLGDRLRERMIRRFENQVRAGGDFRENLRILALQRTLKALGTFGYQIRQLGRERYRSAIPRTLENIRDLGLYMDELSQFMDEFRE